MNLDECLSRIPDYRSYPLVDAQQAELDDIATTYPDLVWLRRIGTSRLGEPLRALTIGDGPADALVIAGPHPNEPVGSLTVSALINLLCEDSALRTELGYRWHFVACADPDGARLNEGWYGTPGDRRAYFDNFYRPDLTDQVEWTFPLTSGDYYFDRTLPETQALIRLMDDVHPSFVCSLHNGEHQGAFFLVNREDAELAQRLTALAERQGIPLEHGEPEILPGTELIAPAVYRTPPGDLVGRTFHTGGGSCDYASRFGALHLVPEVPFWADDRVADLTPVSRTYAEILADAAAARRDLLDTLHSSMQAVAQDLIVSSPFRRSTERTLKAIQALGKPTELVPGLDRLATVAEEYGHRQTTHLLRLRITGVFLRMLDAELCAGNPTPAIREQRELLGERFDMWFSQAEAESPGSVAQIRTLVAVQMGACLIAARYARANTPTGA
jgi:hypothetical protein